MRYEVVRRLARGGMGVVDLARDEQGRMVALKRISLHGTPAEMREARARFDRELEVLRRLEHEAVVPMLDVVDEEGDLVLVMPHLEGGDLAHLVREHGPLPADQVRAIARRLLPALGAAHRLGIVHRDIKPANVLFDAEGRAHLADFGVARTREVTGGLTRPGVVLGSPGYLSPEQARGEEITPASDLASLGATLHYAATGHSPWGDGDGPDVLLRTAKGRPRIDRTVEPSLRRLIASMLRSRPEQRPSAAALAGGIEGTTAIPRLAPRQRTGLVVGAAVVLALGATLATVAVADGADEDAAPTEAPCRPLPYQPCGEPPAPHTDGRDCIEDHADYDGIRANGCETAPDRVDGTELVERIAATIVPADDVDRYPMRVDDAGDLLCNGRLRLAIVAPPGIALRLALLDDEDRLVAETTSADGVPGELSVQDPSCFRDDGGVHVAEVSAIGSDRSAESYVLSRRGGF
ncbi:MAG TPA: serine/threonine-protein kinase [Acidimicrobiales bacterium]|nr:serine/threonine-protein kinase [Acidimicrobiales bacterium]